VWAEIASIVFVALIAGVAWFLLRPRPAFVIRIRGDAAHVIQGKATPLVVSAIADVCRQSGVTTGTITGRSHGKRIRLACSSNISSGCQQQLRNVLLAEWK
jgi:Protein of unknown function (DUF3634)